MTQPDGSVAILNFSSSHGKYLTHAMHKGRPLCRSGRWLGTALAVSGDVTCAGCLQQLEMGRRRYLFATTCNELGGYELMALNGAKEGQRA